MHSGVTPGYRETVADEEAARFHFGPGLFPQLGHRHRRQEGIDQIVFAERHLPQVLPQPVEVGPADAEDAANQPGQWRVFGAGELAIRPAVGERDECAADAGAEVEEALAFLLADQLVEGGDGLAVGEVERHLPGKRAAIDQQQQDESEQEPAGVDVERPGQPDQGHEQGVDQAPPPGLAGDRRQRQGDGADQQAGLLPGHAAAGPAIVGPGQREDEDDGGALQGELAKRGR
jgi:hypothetical protein